MKAVSDALDIQIIKELILDAEASYSDLGKKLGVSGGTIHVRVKKLEEQKIITRKKIDVDFKALGYDVNAFIGIFLEKSSLYETVAKELWKLPQVVRVNYTTGNYNMFVELVCKDINQLRDVLQVGLQQIKGIERTETLISLEETFCRRPSLDDNIG